MPISPAKQSTVNARGSREYLAAAFVGLHDEAKKVFDRIVTKHAAERVGLNANNGNV